MAKEQNGDAEDESAAVQMADGRSVDHADKACKGGAPKVSFLKGFLRLSSAQKVDESQ